MTEYQVDAAMIGEGFDGDLTEFCDNLQKVVGDDVTIVPITSSHNGARNNDERVVSDADWREALTMEC